MKQAEEIWERPMDSATRERAAQLFAAMSHPARLRIVELLCQGERGVNDIADALGLSQSSTSQHLAVLTRAGVLVVAPRGTARVYRIRGPRIGRILVLIEEFCQINSLYGVPPETEGNSGLCDLPGGEDGERG